MNKDIQKELELIKERNKRVEKDKAWETSLIRRVLIAILTYIVVIIYTYTVNKYNNIFLSSLVPVIGFSISTLSLGFARKTWEKYKK